MARRFGVAGSPYLYGLTATITEPFTVAAWVYRYSNSSTMRILQVGQIASWTGWHLRGESGSNTVSATSNNDGAETASTSSTNFTVNAWHHVVGVFTSSSSRLVYVDGVAGTSDSTSSSITPSEPHVLLVGRSAFGTQLWDGLIGRIAMWGVALNAGEITMLSRGVSPLMVRREVLKSYHVVNDTKNVAGISGIPERGVGNQLQVWSGAPLAFYPPNPRLVLDAQPLEFGSAHVQRKVFLPATVSIPVKRQVPSRPRLALGVPLQPVTSRTGFSMSNGLYSSDPPVTTIPLTMSVWARLATNSNGYIFCLDQGAGSHGVRLAAYSGTPNTVRALVDGTAGSTQTLSGTFTINEWHCVTFVYTSSTSRELFVDGVSVETGSVDTTPNGISISTIGIDEAVFLNPFQGQIAHAAIWNVALTAAEVYLLGSKGASPMTVRRNALKGYWPLHGSWMERNVVSPFSAYNEVGLVNTITNLPGMKVRTIDARQQLGRTAYFLPQPKAPLFQTLPRNLLQGPG